MHRCTGLAALTVLLAGAASVVADEFDTMMKQEPAASKKKDAEDSKPPLWDVAFGGNIESDYIFRGISQSAHKPSIGSYTEFRYDPRKDLQFYSAIAGQSLDYPNRAAAEIDLYAGVRPTFGKLSLDLGAWYYWYPGGILFNGTGDLGPNPRCTNRLLLPGGCNIIEANLSYWEVFARGSYAATDTFTIGANVFYSPSWLSTDADGTWASATAKLSLPANTLPHGLGAYLSGEFGHYWLTRTKAFYGNTVFPGQANGINLPDYSTWNVGAALTWKVFTLDLRYFDTDLSRGHCNVLTADHTATFKPENISPINPSGLGSHWCDATFVARLSFDLTVNDNLK